MTLLVLAAVCLAFVVSGVIAIAVLVGLLNQLAAARWRRRQ